jgi:UDP-N-acetyl-D-glucosamine/UDP-N-acetyl-D-galactosamine dehydrogenase
MAIYSDIIEKKKSIAVVGLGYVGLPIALEFAKTCKVIGFDISEERIEMMRNRIDPSNEVSAEAFDGRDITFTADLKELASASFYIVAVPTPVDEHNVPNLSPVLSASKTIGAVIKKGDYVVFESTVYPGCTEEDCLPVIEALSGLKNVIDFKLGYSPERINPGDTVHTLTNVVKVTSGCDAESAEEIAKVYELIIKAGVHRASSIKVAEAAKIIENTQRDLNIALMNELSIIFDKMKINTYEVLEAAGTKWNFLKFSPGLVGGHCIGVDPYYLTYKSEELGYQSKVILAGRVINDEMPAYVAKKTVQKIIKAGKDIGKSRVLIMGVTFKEDVSDIRNSKVIDVIRELEGYNVSVDAIDPHASSHEVYEEYGFALCEAPSGKYDAIILAVGHKEYLNYSENDLENMCSADALIVDIKGNYRNKISTLKYWSL